MSNADLLQKRMLILNECISMVDMPERKWGVESHLPQFAFRGIQVGIDHDMLDLLIMPVPLPKIILIEGPNADYFQVIGGQALLETALAVLADESIGPYSLRRRVLQKDLDVVIFRCNMKSEDVAFLAKKFYNINITEE